MTTCSFVYHEPGVGLAGKRDVDIRLTDDL
jgi:hypothetical protein